MPLPNVFSDKKDTSLFLAIFLSDTTVRSALWRVDEGEIEILKSSQMYVFSDLEDLLVKADQSLQELDKLSEKTDQVLFCLESNWANGDILDEKKPILKKLSNNLSLKVVGFVVGSEVILDYLKNEKAVNTALILAVQESGLELIFVEAGAILARKRVGRSDDLSADLTEALARLEQSPTVSKRSYPARIILYSTEISDEQLGRQQQKLIKKDWRESHNFLQRPVVEIIKSEESIKAIIKIGGKVAGKAQGLIDDSSSAETSLDKEGKPTFVDKQDENDFGFTQFAVDTQSKANVNDNFIPVVKATKKPLSFSKPKLSLNTNFINREISHHKLAAIGFLAGLVFLFFGSIIAISNIGKLSILLTPLKQTVSKDVSITLDSDISQSDPDKMLLAAKVTEKTVIGSSTAPSTGIKIIGDAAKGQVEILNKTDSEKTFTKGTAVSFDGKIFLTDEETVVGAAEINSTEDGETKVYGKKEVSVTAQEIGAEGNIVAESKFSVEDFASSSYEAKSLAAFTGGASREIQVVSKQDMEDIFSSLKTELIGQANNEFKSESKDGKYFIVTGKSKTLKDKYSAQIGDEVNSFSLDLELIVEAYSYNAQDLIPLAQATLSSQLPEGFILVGEPQILSSPSEDKVETELVLLEANLSSDSQANLDKTALLSAVLGRSVNEAEKILKAKNEIVDIKFSFEPSFAASLIKKIPNDEKRVKIIVSGEE